MAHNHDADGRDAHSKDHSHSHGHEHGHGHGHGDGSADRNRVALAAIVTFIFMVAEVVGGILSGSLALLADAGHMLTDAGALVLAWFGFRLAERPADGARSFGWGRFRILAAFVNGLTLILISAWIIIEGGQRLLAPSPVDAPLMIAVAALGLVANLVAFAILHGGDRDNLNMSAALWHVAGDLLGSLAAVLAGIIIFFTGWLPADPLLSLFIAGLVGWAGWRVAGQAGRILLESAPPDIDTAHITEDLEAHLPGPARIHHVHAWSLTERQPLVTLEIAAPAGADAEALRLAAKARLASRWGITHSTVEVACGADTDVKACNAG